MISETKLRANRLNALKSTGPRTLVGKSRSCKNALAHGLFTNLPVLPLLGESSEEWDAFRSAVVQNLHADSAAEVAVAERIAQLLYRLRRVAAYEAATMAPPTNLRPCPRRSGRRRCRHWSPRTRMPRPP